MTEVLDRPAEQEEKQRHPERCCHVMKANDAYRVETLCGANVGPAVRPQDTAADSGGYCGHGCGLRRCPACMEFV